ETKLALHKLHILPNETAQDFIYRIDEEVNTFAGTPNEVSDTDYLSILQNGLDNTNWGITLNTLRSINNDVWDRRRIKEIVHNIETQGPVTLINTNNTSNKQPTSTN